MVETIDAHQHFWRYNPTNHSWISDDMKMLLHDFMPPDLERRLNESGISGCVAVQADQTEEETEFLLQLAQEYSFIKGVIGWVDLQADKVEERLAHYARNNYLKGIRHHVQDETDDKFLLCSNFLRGIKKLKKYNLCYDILIFAKHLPVAVGFANHFPDQTFVLDHIAKPNIKEQKIAQWEKGIRVLAQHPGMYCKLSGMVTEADWKNWEPDNFKPYLDVIFDAFGVDRLMFGSDWPVCMLAAGYQEVWQIVKNYISSLSREEQDLIMGGNARRVYNL